MKKANFGCLLLFHRTCSAYGHVTSTLHGRDALIPNDFEGSLPISDYRSRACSGCKKPKDISTISPSRLLVVLLVLLVVVLLVLLLVVVL